MATPKPSDIKLKITEKKRDDDKIQLTITVPGSSTADIIKSATFVLAMQNRLDMQNIKLEDLEKTVLDTVGEAQLKAFSNYYVMQAMMPFAITEKNLEIIMEPEVSSAMEVAPGRDFTFTAVLTPKPRYELSSYDPVTVKIPAVEVTEEEIDAQILNLAERSAQTVEDKDAAVADNSEIVFGITTAFKDDGEPVTNLTAEKRVYSLGQGWLPKEFDDQIIGMKAGESRTFDFELPGPPNLDGTEGESRTVTTSVSLTQVNKKVTPAITTAWVEVNMPEAKTVDGLREMLRKEGMEYKQREQDNMKFFLTASALAERFQGYIADEIYEYTRGDMLQNLNEQLRQQGMTMEQYLQQMGMDEQQFGMQFMMQVRETLRQSFALDALARHLKLTVNEEDIADTVSRMAPGNEERARQEIEGSGRKYLLIEAATRTKANKWLIETATFETIETPKQG